eukprot:1940776-Heterocapsa_arctica.AAC.1
MFDMLCPHLHDAGYEPAAAPADPGTSQHSWAPYRGSAGTGINAASTPSGSQAGDARLRTRTRSPGR